MLPCNVCIYECQNCIYVGKWWYAVIGLLAIVRGSVGPVIEHGSGHHKDFMEVCPGLFKNVIYGYLVDGRSSGWLN